MAITLNELIKQLCTLRDKHRDLVLFVVNDHDCNLVATEYYEDDDGTAIVLSFDN